MLFTRLKDIMNSRIEVIPPPGAYIYYLTTKTRKGIYETAAKEIVSKVDSGRILDIGTGPGCLPIEIAKKTPHVEIIGVDASGTLIRIARKSAKRECVEDRIKFEVKSAYDLGFKHDYFDLVVSSGVIHHLKYPLQAFNESFRVLKPNNEAWIYEFVTDAASKEIKQGLKKMGVPCFPTALFFRLHGLKYDEYIRGRIARALEESLFEKYEFEKRWGIMKIVLIK